MPALVFCHWHVQILGKGRGKVFISLPHLGSSVQTLESIFNMREVLMKTRELFLYGLEGRQRSQNIGRDLLAIKPK